MRILLSILLLTLAVCAGAGTINLVPGPYCATSISGGQYNGVTAGACAVIPPSDPGAGCPAVAHTPWGDKTLVTRASICYGATCRGLRANTDVTTWSGLFGLGEGTGSTPVPWPGIGGAAPVIKGFPRAGYLCVPFDIPAGYHTGSTINPSYLRDLSPTLSVSISRVGGDFGAALPTPGCLAANVYAADRNLALWKTTANAPGSWCNLTPGRYYLNATFGNPGCGSATCALGIVSYHN